MKRPLLLFAVGLMANTAFSQQYTGFGYDNYAGTQSLLFNPANVAGSKYKIDVNLFSLSSLAGNNAYELDRKRLMKFDLSGLREGTHYFKQNNTDQKKLWINSDVMGPSALITVGKKSGLGITTRMRTIANSYNLSNNSFQFFSSDGGLFDTDITEKDVQLKVHAFAEVGLTYGRIISQSEHHTLKLGITGKYIHGVGVGSISSKNMLVNMTSTKDFTSFNGDMTVQYSSNIDELQDGNFSNVFKGSGKMGWGVDAGLVYEFRPGGKKDSTARKTWLDKDQTPYKLRMSLAVTDFGFVKYKNSPHGNSYLLDAAGFNADEFKKADGEDYDAYFDRLEIAGILDPEAWQENLNVKLPMAIRADIDYHIYKRLFINAGAVVNMISKTKNPLSAHYTTSFTVTPRLEKKWFSIYAPVYYNMEEQLSFGAGFRVGPLFVGSASVISNLVSNKNISAMDVHVGLHIPLFQPSNIEKKKKKKKEEEEEEKKEKEGTANDKDKDGVTDDKDECPDVAGEIALIGCPDKDGDGVADKNDKCPDVKGSINHNGCAAPDTDGDGVNDDDDKCPQLRGSLENGGCPEVSAEVASAVDFAGRKIHFVTGSATIQESSHEALGIVAKALKADANLKLSIKGHTDNVGKSSKNNRLSLKRAQAVKAYLVAKGIPASRLKVQAFGEKKPTATNKTMGGKARNRRVELILGYE